jgi:hypothetical protein
MTLTLGQIRGAVQGNLGDNSRSTDFNRWINDGLKEISSRYDFLALRDSSSFATIASTSTYTLPTDYKSFFTFRIKSSSGYVVVEKLEEEFDQEYPYPENDAEGVPEYFIKRSTTGYILYPTPDAAYDCVMRYNKWHPTLSADASTHSLESYCDDLVVAASTWKAYASFQETEDVTTWLGMFEKLLKQAIVADGVKPTHMPRLGGYRGNSNVPPSEYWNRPDWRK